MEKQTQALPPKQNSLFTETWRRFRKNKTALVGMVIVMCIVLLAIFADQLYDYETMAIKPNYDATLQPPSSEHYLGTDEFGRDVLARLIHGSRISLIVAAISITVGTFIGSLFGAIAGYFGGIVDSIIMRIMDVFLAIPNMLLAITVVAALGTSSVNLILAIAIAGMPRFARIARASVLSVRSYEFIEAAKANGASSWRIIFEEVIPNSLAPIIVQYSIALAGAILTISSMSFIGLGVQAPTPEWGAMLSNGRQYFKNSGYLIVFPGLAIAITALAINLLGDGLRDALDPKLKQ